MDKNTVIYYCQSCNNPFLETIKLAMFEAPLGGALEGHESKAEHTLHFLKCPLCNTIYSKRPIPAHWYNPPKVAETTLIRELYQKLSTTHAWEHSIKEILDEANRKTKNPVK